MFYKQIDNISLNKDIIFKIEQLYRELDSQILSIINKNPENLNINIIELFYSKFRKKRNDIIFQYLISSYKDIVNKG